ncbi:hypothetical protein FBY35_1072 [Streptomyces sp. SLBN-118]|nr:hypothetical protein FBY35_1072 [Streptomyces sp. SLBN-118]
MNDQHSHRVEGPLERRLRAALQARANAVDLHDLRPASPPLGSAAVRGLVRRAFLALFGLAAAAACVLLLMRQQETPTPVKPSQTPSVSHLPNPTSPPAPAPAPGPDPPPEIPNTTGTKGIHDGTLTPTAPSPKANSRTADTDPTPRRTPPEAHKQPSPITTPTPASPLEP